MTTLADFFAEEAARLTALHKEWLKSPEAEEVGRKTEERAAAREALPDEPENDNDDITECPVCGEDSCDGADDDGESCEEL